MIAEVHGDGLPLIAVHGFGVDHRIMLPLENMLGEAPWQRVYLDLPWAENAIDTGATTPREVAEEVLDEVREITDGGPFAIIGNSFGAMAARHVAHALRNQCLGLATLAGAFQLDHALRRVPSHETIVYDAEILQQAGDWRESFEEMAVIHTAATLRSFERFVLPGLRGANQQVLDRLSASYTEAYSPESMAVDPFTAPSLHIFGRQDQVVGYEDGQSLIPHYPRGSFVALDSAGHNLHLEQPEVVGVLIREWLDRAKLHAS